MVNSIASSRRLLLTTIELLQLLSKIKRRKYLTNCKEFKGNKSIWYNRYNSGDENSFSALIGFNYTTFNYLLQLLTPHCQHLIKPNRSLGRPLSLDLPAQLGLTLQFLHTKSHQYNLCDTYGASPGKISQIISTMLPLLGSVLSTDHNARIMWPNANEMAVFANQIHQSHPNLPGDVFGLMDGLNFECYNNRVTDIQNAYYNGYKCCATIGNILVFTPDGCICFATYNHPGSRHDAYIAREVYDMLEDHTTGNFKILADSAFQFKHDRIITPFKKGQLSTNPIIAQQQEALHRRVVAARQPVEWGMGGIQSLFPRLTVPLSASNFRYNGILILLCFRLFNLRTRLQADGGNQITTVYGVDYIENIFVERNPSHNRYYNIRE